MENKEIIEYLKNFNGLSNTKSPQYIEIKKRIPMMNINDEKNEEIFRLIREKDF